MSSAATIATTIIVAPLAGIFVGGVLYWGARRGTFGGRTTALANGVLFGVATACAVVSRLIPCWFEADPWLFTEWGLRLALCFGVGWLATELLLWSRFRA